MKRTALLTLAAIGAALLAGCGGGGSDDTAAPTPASSGQQADTTTTTGADTTTGAQAAPAATEGGDPREDGFEVALGEWAVTPEAEAIRPGRVVFLIANRGTMPHGFEIELEGDDSSGSGSGRDRGKVETRVLQPGETTEVELELTEGVWKLECNVDGHDDMGMETLLEVRKDAPLGRGGGGDAGAQAGTVSIKSFAYAPPRLEAGVGEEVRWTNHDPADHTVTAEDGNFDSGTMTADATFAHTFDRPGEYRYICTLHPGMEGVVVVR